LPRCCRELGIDELVGRVTWRVIVSKAMECRIRNHDGGPSLFFVTGEIARSTLPGTSLIIAMMPVMAISRAVLIRPMATVPRPRVDTEYPVHPADRATDRAAGDSTKWTGGGIAFAPSAAYCSTSRASFMSATRSCLAPSTRFRGFRRRGFLSSLSPTRRAAHADALLGISPGWDFERRWTISTRPQLSLGTFSPIEI
jgi:hypothetical protein